MSASDGLVYAFYSAVTGTGRGIKHAWNTVTGTNMLKNRYLLPKPELQVVPAVVGTMMGLPIALGVTIDTGMSLPVILSAAAAAVLAPPVLCHLPYAMYASGKKVAREREYQLEYKRRLALEPPKPEPKRLPPAAPLI